ncbi:choline BCCT transporter BetT [Paeniglutamicibacter cryotolerans]|uniref:Choline/glycine/proline betaine transport protein n=1 Tax=Paeniglutamicibacter cryotolerans TaxID=670079 RepID=A0A839QFV2_9MICC|nr:choline BCCT transporter BetT [Paeniglutamicibacter cryotolerans]MBB2994770.1 choline/glycine/proline betaine transport protein [Paeniglutamicibacter cryotolerans]
MSEAKFSKRSTVSTSYEQSGSAPPGRGPTRINKVVFFGSAAGVLAIIAWSLIDQAGANAVIGAVVSWVGSTFGWWYSLIVVVVLLFVIGIALSKVGKTRLGPDHSRPGFNLFTWAAMLFAAGIGIDLMFFSVAEPVTQYLAPPTGDGSTVEAARMAMAWTLFHYGILGWGLYALIGLALAYFAYRHNLPLSIRSALYPILGKRIHGPLGHGVDIAAVLGAIFGIATSLGIGVAQLNFGLSFMFGIEESKGVQIALIALSVIMATISVLTGVEKGIRRLSELNIILCIVLMLFILFAGKTRFLLDGIVQNIGDTLSLFPGMALNTFAYDRPDAWLNGWTLFFWAWWIAWAPFVGLFLARISRGRTIRQFVAGVLVVPFAFILLWISIFGNSALSLVMGGNAEFGDIAMNTPERGFYSLLEQYPAVPLVAGIATFTGLLFYVTSADSGALVMANFTSHLKDSESDGPKWVRVFWAVATGLLTLAMLLIDGVATLQQATVIMGLPFSIVLVFIMLGLYKALRIERSLAGSYKKTLHTVLSSRTGAGGIEHHRSWHQRLARVMSYPGAEQAQRFVKDVVEPALEEVKAEFTDAGASGEMTIKPVGALGIDSVDLIIRHGGERTFKYQVYPVQLLVPSYAKVTSAGEKYYRMEVFSQEGSHGYDLMGRTREQIISDVLDQYEVHMSFLRGQSESAGRSRVSDDSPDKNDWDTDFDTGMIPTIKPAAKNARRDGDEIMEEENA